MKFFSKYKNYIIVFGAGIFFVSILIFLTSINYKDNSEKIKGIGCEIKSGKVVCFGEVVSGVDPKTFKVINDLYSKDKNHVYEKWMPLALHGGHQSRGYNVVKSADPKTFKIIDEYYEKDKNHVYYQGNLIKDSEGRTFKKIDNQYSKDKKNVYRLGEKLDKADPKTFEIIGKNYARDKNHLYYYHRLMENVDPETWKKIGGMYYKDKDNIYIWDSRCCTGNLSVIKRADMSTFEVMKSGWLFTRDKNHIFYGNLNIEGVDLKTFKILNEKYSKDKKNAYFEGKRINGVDIETFISLNSSWTMYSKDKKHVYYGNKIIVGADANTFKAIFMNGWSFSDKNHTYFRGKIND